MEKYAVIKVGNRQYTVRENDVVQVERQTTPLRADVLFYSDGAKNLVGEPVLKDVTVKLSLVSETRERKIRVNRFKSKSRYRKGKGHKQHLSILKVERISLAGEKDTDDKTVSKEPVKTTVQEKKIKTSAKAEKDTKKAKTTKTTKTAKSESKKLTKKAKK